MKLEDARDAYESFSGKASVIIRQLSLAGVGLIWVFKSVGTSFSNLALDAALLNGALFIFVSLLFDLLQYLVATGICLAYYRYKEGKGTSGSGELLVIS